MTSAPLTLSQFKVDLTQLAEAIGTIQTQAGLIGFRASLIASTINGVHGNWVTPAEIPFGEMAQICVTRMTALTDLLAEMIGKMRTAHQNYEQAEQANVGNFRR